MDTPEQPSISLVIPAHNEEAYLPRLLRSVEEARRRYDGSLEVIVVDNASTDGTAEAAREHGCRVVSEEKRSIAAVRNRGAREASGRMLAFADADMQIDPDTFGVIVRAMETGRYVAGATGVKLERWSFGLRVTYALMVPFVWLTKMDTGVVFCSRQDFLDAGGYAENLLFAEDVRFLLDMKRHGRPTRRKLARETSVKAIASTRKFDRHGEWHYLAMFARLLFWMLFAPRRIDAFARSYWYDRQREPSRSPDSGYPINRKDS